MNVKLHFHLHLQDNIFEVVAKASERRLHSLAASRRSSSFRIVCTRCAFQFWCDYVCSVCVTHYNCSTILCDESFPIFNAFAVHCFQYNLLQYEFSLFAGEKPLNYQESNYACSSISISRILDSSDLSWRQEMGLWSPAYNTFRIIDNIR